MKKQLKFEVSRSGKYIDNQWNLKCLMVLSLRDKGLKVGMETLPDNMLLDAVKRNYDLEDANEQVIKDFLFEKYQRVINRNRSEDPVKKFYASHAWQKLRETALNKFGHYCQYCGRSPDEGVTLKVGHIKSIAKRWDLRLDINNVQIACDRCI